MPSLRDIKRRITSVRSTQKITRAMKMVSAAKLRRAQESILRARPYAYHMRDLVNRVAVRVPSDMHPLLATHDEGRIALIVVTSDRGLCGGYNSNLVAATMEAIRTSFAGREVDLVVVGRKGIEVLRRRPCNIVRSYTKLMEDDPMRAAELLIQHEIAAYIEGGLAELHCVYHEFKSALSQKLTIEQLLPFKPEMPESTVIDYIYEPDKESVLTELLTTHLSIQMNRVLYEAAASEYGARQTAMDSATKNAGEMIERLTLLYNRARQTAITKEVIEIVSGAEAL